MELQEILEEIDINKHYTPLQQSICLGMKHLTPH